MRLIRNVSEDGRGKYGVVDNRTGAVLDGGEGAADEFFVIKLKDRYAAAALQAYADAAKGDDPEYAEDVAALARRAGPNSPFCKTPD